MSDFPTLSVPPINQIPYEPLDNAIITPTGNGKMISRKRFTTDITSIGTIEYVVESVDLALIKAQWLTVGTYGTFSYTLAGTSYTVRYAAPIKYVDLPAGYTRVYIQLLTA